jgi:hypothetical protein
MSRNPRPGYRRLELWLPDGHPLWSLPPRTRSAYARALLDIGLAVERRLAGIEEKLDHLLGAMVAEEEKKLGVETDSSRNNGGKREIYNHNTGTDEKKRQDKNDYVADFLTALERATTFQ